MSQARVLSVGQCGYDHGQVTRFLRDAFSARAESADTAMGALAALRSGGYSLVMVNRVLDADGTSGLDLIRAIKADPALAPIPTLLVSNYADAQDQAAALGAIPGFGKSDLGRPKAREVLAPLLVAAEA